MLVDTNAIIEAVRTGCWAAITGQCDVESAQVCAGESRHTPDPIPSGYVPVTEAHLEKLTHTHAVSRLTLAAFKLAYSDADALDAGELDLLALAYAELQSDWVLCSPDKAVVRAAVRLGFGDRLWSLEQLAEAVGTRPNPPLQRQFRSEWLVSFRTKVHLEDH